MYIRPERIRWSFPLPEDKQDPDAWIANIASKSTRGLARRLDELLEIGNLQFEIRPLTAALYADWHTFYVPTMIAQHHDVLAKPEWFELRKAAYENIYLLEVRTNSDQKRIGASIVTLKSGNCWGKPYRASERIDVPGVKNFSLGALLDLLAMRFIFSHQPVEVNSGSSRNAFGHFNTLGYLAYKLKIGYKPWYFPEYPASDVFPQTTPQTPTAWFVIEEPAPQQPQLLRLLRLSHGHELYSDELKKFIAFHQIDTLVI